MLIIGFIHIQIFSAVPYLQRLSFPVHRPILPVVRNCGAVGCKSSMKRPRIGNGFLFPCHTVLDMWWRIGERGCDVASVVVAFPLVREAVANSGFLILNGFVNQWQGSFPPVRPCRLFLRELQRRDQPPRILPAMPATVRGGRGLKVSGVPQSHHALSAYCQRV